MSIVLLALVASQIGWDAVGDTLADASWAWFGAAVVLVFLGLVGGGIRWYLFVRAADLRSGPVRTARAYAVGTFSNNVLPTGFGGDLVRAVMIAPTKEPLVARAFASVFADRVNAFVCSLVLAWLGVALEGGDMPGSLFALLALSTSAAVLGIGAGTVALKGGGLGAILPGAVRPWTGEAASALLTFARDRRLKFETVGLGLAVQALMVLSAGCLSETLGLGIQLGVLAVVAPLALTAVLIPVSIAGFGVREAAFVGLLGPVGVSAADATLFSLLSVAAMTIASLPGGVAILLGGGRGNPDPDSAGRPRLPPTADELVVVGDR